MSEIRNNGRVLIDLDKPRYLLFSLNAIDIIQDKYGNIEQMGEELDNDNMISGIKTVRWLLTVLLNEGAEAGEPELTEKEVGKLIHIGNLKEAKTAIFKAFSLGTSGMEEPPEPDDEDDLDDDEKNVTGGKGK